MSREKLLPYKQIREISAFLASCIQPFFEQGKLHFTTFLDDTASYPDGNVTLSNNEFLDAAKINFSVPTHKQLSKAVKTATFTIGETIPVKVAQLHYFHLFNCYHEGVLSKKQHKIIESVQPVMITLNGEEQAVAKLCTQVVLPETELQKLKAQYASRYSKEATMQLAVTGPASLSGGNTVSIGGRHWLEYTITIYATSYTVQSVDEA